MRSSFFLLLLISRSRANLHCLGFIGTSVDQGIAYLLMVVALVLTYLIHPLDASSIFWVEKLVNLYSCSFSHLFVILHLFLFLWGGEFQWGGAFFRIRFSADLGFLSSCNATVCARSLSDGIITNAPSVTVYFKVLFCLLLILLNTSWG